MKKRKLLSFLLSTVLLLGTVISPTVFADDTANFVYAGGTFDDAAKEEGGNDSAYTEYMSVGRLDNLYAKIRDIKAGESLNIAYFGGSITNGSGSSANDSKSWRALTGAYIADLVSQSHPDVEVVNNTFMRDPTTTDNPFTATEGKITVNNLNAAVGATGSYFGIHRLCEDMGLQFGAKPDLVFLEFAYNDNCAGDSTSRVYTDSNGNSVLASAADYESIIRVIRSYAPECEIVGLLTTGVQFKDAITYDKFPQLSAHRAILRHYGIPYLYVGRDLAKVILTNDPTTAGLTVTTCRTNASWTEYFADEVHPNDKGHAFYAGKVQDYLSEQMNDAAARDAENAISVTDRSGSPTVSYFDPAVLKADAHAVRIAGLYADNFSLLSGWSVQTPLNANQYNSLYTPYNGASLAFRFTGDSLGMWVARSTKGGYINATVYKVDDDGNRSSDVYATSRTRTGYDNDYNGLGERWVILNSADYGTYDVEITVSDSSDYGSTAIIRRIFWNGSDTVTPLMHPDVPYEKLRTIDELDTIEVISRYGKDSSEKTNLTVTEENGECTYTYKNSNSSYRIKTICRNYNLASFKKINISQYPYIIVEYYIDSSLRGKVGGMGFWVRGTANMVAQSGSNLANQMYSIPDDEIEYDKWATAVVDIRSYLTNANALKKGMDPTNDSWARIELLPFGDGLASAKEENGLKEGDSIKIRSIRFADAIPYIVENNTVYMSPEGTVTTDDGVEHDAFLSFKRAFDALGTEGGTIYFHGITDTADTFTDGTAAHGPVTVIGTGENTENVVYVQNTAPDYLSIKHGDVTFENFTISYENAPNERWIQTYGNTLTIGQNMRTAVGTSGNSQFYIHAAPFASSGVGTASDFVFEGSTASYSKIASMGGYMKNGAVYSGHTEMTFNSGNFGEIYGNARNDGEGTHIGYGDVHYTFNGGTYSAGIQIYTGSSKSGTTKATKKTGALLGFEITSDIDGAVPTVNGVHLVKNGDLYDLSAFEGIETDIYFDELAVGSTEKESFDVMGAQIRISESETTTDLRFVAHMGDALVGNEKTIQPTSTNDTDIGYGFVVYPKDLLGDAVLTKETSGAKVVPAVKTFETLSDGSIYFTVCITDIAVKNFNRFFAVRPYITYTDSLGTVRTVYGEQYSGASLVSIAEMAIRKGDAAADYLQEHILDAYHNYVGE